MAVENLQGYGTVSGRVLGDAGEPLPGASIVIRELIIGSSSSLDGLFNLPRVPYGTHEIEVSYIGFQTYTAIIELNTETLSLGDIVLNPSVNALGEVIITGSLEGQQRAFNQQKNADNIKTIVSADLIGRFPDINVGEAMQRVSGVTIERDNGEGSIVKIRGTPKTLLPLPLMENKYRQRMKVVVVQKHWH